MYINYISVLKHVISITTLQFFTGCSSVSLSLVVKPSLGSFGEIGVVSCDNDAVLIYANGSQSSINQTRCSTTATWDGLNDLECWSGIQTKFFLILA